MNTDKNLRFDSYDRRHYGSAALDEFLNLVVRILPVARHQGTAIVVAGKYWTREEIQRLVKRGFGCVGQIKRHTEPHEFFKQLPAGRRDRAIAAGAKGIRALA